MIALAFVVLLGLVQIGNPGGAQEATATIRGRVTEKESGRPLARAVVHISRAANPRQRLYARTSDDGRYEFAGLAPGEYTGLVEPGEHRATHLTQGFVDPANPRRRQLVLGPGEVREDVDIALPRALAMTVRVVDEWGGPLAGLPLEVTHARTGRTATVIFDRGTDDRGRMRIYGLAPGSYIVCIEQLGLGTSRAKAPEARARFLPTCYPSAVDPAEAEAIQLEDADIEGVEIRMRRGRTYTISGIVTDASGAPLTRGFVSLNRFERGSNSGTSLNIGGDGRFTLNGVLPGEYAIKVSIGGPDRPEERREPESAYLPLRVDSDIEGLVVSTTKTIEVHGRIVLEDPTAPLPAPQGSGLWVGARLAGDWLSGTGSVRTAIMNADRGFVLDGLFGHRTLEFANIPRGWYVKSVRYHGKEIIDETVEFTAAGGGPALEVILSNRGAVVTGWVFDEQGNAQRGGRVLMIRDDVKLRSLNPFSGASVTTSGTFRLGPVRGGKYRLIAIPPGLDTPDAETEEMEKLLEAAEGITLGANEERTLDLRVWRP